MTSSLLRSLRFVLPFAAAAAAFGANTQVSPDKPVINFRLPNFTPEGYRSWLVRGSEAKYHPKDNQIDVKELTLSVFSGTSEDRLLTMILSPSAHVLPNESLVRGDDPIRVINDEYEATGTGWVYSHKEKKVLLKKKVRVAFSAEFKDILK